MLDGEVAGGAGAAAKGSAAFAAGLGGRLADLQSRGYPELQNEWRRLYRASPPPRMSRELLELGIGWKLQERMLGGLTAATRRRIGDLSETMESRGDLAKSRAVRLRAGARLVREWNGETHEVLITEEGFRWRGETWKSLSAIAREITGAHWSGPRFFGLARKARGGDPGAARTASEELADAQA